MIRVNDTYYIDVDSMSYNAKIDLHKTDKNGVGLYKVIGYYSTLRDAIKGIYNYELKNRLSGEEKSIKEALEIVKAVSNEMQETLNKIEG